MVAELYARLGFSAAGAGEGGETRSRAAPAALTDVSAPILVTRV
jgi:hypothetical protein